VDNTEAYFFGIFKNNVVLLLMVCYNIKDLIQLSSPCLAGPERSDFCSRVGMVPPPVFGKKTAVINTFGKYYP